MTTLTRCQRIVKDYADIVLRLLYTVRILLLSLGDDPIMTGDKITDFLYSEPFLLNFYSKVSKCIQTTLHRSYFFSSNTVGHGKFEVLQFDKKNSF